MAIFFKKLTSPPARETVEMRLREHLENALREAAPVPGARMDARVTELAQPATDAVLQATEKPSAIEFQTRPFLAALGIFVFMLVVAIGVDWAGTVKDPSVYSAMATTVLGVVIGFFGGDAAGTASSR